MSIDKPYSQREMDIIMKNITKEFTMAYQELDSKIDNFGTLMNGRIDSVKVELNYLKILTTGTFLAIASALVAYFMHL